MSTPENLKKVKKYVAKLEKVGHKVYWPIRDTDQNDNVGIKICDQNFGAIYDADEIHIWYLKESTGIHFDMGGVYMLVSILGFKKRIVFVNKREFDGEDGDLKVLKGKNFAKVLEYLDKDTAKK